MQQTRADRQNPIFLLMNESPLLSKRILFAQALSRANRGNYVDIIYNHSYREKVIGCKIQGH